MPIVNWIANSIGGSIVTVISGLWILVGGTWNDSGVWMDSETWNDN